MTDLIVPVILAGGLGTRLWPVSRTARPKQFLPLTGASSLYQDTLRRVADRLSYRLVQPALGFRGLFEAMSLVAIVALAAYLFVSRKHGTMRRRLREVDES